MLGLDGIWVHQIPGLVNCWGLKINNQGKIQYFFIKKATKLQKPNTTNTWHNLKLRDNFLKR